MRTCVYPGSFDPVTRGHEDVIRRAAKLFDRVIVAVMHNPAKKGCFPVEQRIRLIQQVVQDLPNVETAVWHGLTVDFVLETGADCVVRGLRSAQDFESERTLAHLNQHLYSEMETVFLLSRPEHACISSSAVREAGLFGASVEGLVPDCIRNEVQSHFTPAGSGK